MKTATGHFSEATPEGFEAFVRDHMRVVRRIAASRVGPDASDDVVSETFAAAWQYVNANPGQPIGRAWLIGVALNKSKMEVRAEHAWHERLRRAWTGASDLELVGDDIPARLDAQASRRALLRGFSTLSDTERDVMAMTALADMSAAEIAQALDMPSGTVRSHLHRARNTLERTVLVEGVRQ